MKIQKPHKHYVENIKQKNLLNQESDTKYAM